MKTVSTFIVASLFALSLAAQEPAAPSQSPTTPAQASDAKPVPKGVVEGKLIHKVNPFYPPEAKAQRIQGPVVVRATIQKDGSLLNLAVVSGDPALVNAALEAVRQWRYEPYLLNGEPVEVNTQITVNFKLGDLLVYTRKDPAPIPAEYANVRHLIRVSQGVAEGMLVKKTWPDYPSEAKAARIMGSVRLAAIIDYDGKIYSLALVSGHPILTPSAIEAVKHWEYKPFILNGQPVQIDTQITINFTLSSY